MKKVISVFVTMLVTCCLVAQNNIITYTASEKLEETHTQDFFRGVHTKAFKVVIVSHTFSDGKGTITFAGDLTSIGSEAFRYCQDIHSITIPASVKEMGRYAFSGVCNVIYSGKANGAPWGAKCVNGYVVGPYIFADKSQTKLVGHISEISGDISIPSSVKEIGDDAFRGCIGLTSVVLPNTVKEIGDHAFSGCKSLTSVILPNTVKKIGYDAFFGCIGLTSVVLPNTVKEIGDHAFCGCRNLSSVTFPNSLKHIGDGAFSGCRSLTSVTIPNSVKEIGRYAFSDCSHLSSVTIPASVTSIGQKSFSYCRSLSSIEVPSTVKEIGEDAFLGIKNVIYSGKANGAPWGAESITSAD